MKVGSRDRKLNTGQDCNLLKPYSSDPHPPPNLDIQTSNSVNWRTNVQKSKPPGDIIIQSTAGTSLLLKQKNIFIHY